MPRTNQLLLIGLDAADPILIESWIEDGRLPNLAVLKKSGTYSRLNTSAKFLAGSPWPTFYTGRNPSQHGIYEEYQWCHDKLEFARPTSDWIPVSPFWRHLDGDVDVIAYDVPMTQDCRNSKGIEISGWAGHDNWARPDAYPKGLLTKIAHKFGTWPMIPETFGHASIDNLLELSEHLFENTARSTKLALWLLKHPWNFAIIVFGALHRASHRLWDRSSIEGNITEDKGALFDRALRRIYVACDDAIGQIVAANPEAMVMVFSLHGMMTNTSRVDFLEEMLARILTGKISSSFHAGLFRRIGEALPNSWRRSVTTHLPHRFRNRLMTMWTTGGIDWENTAAFALRADLQGYVRINLKGREKQGIISPGRDYSDLCTQIAEGLMSFRDASTGQPLIEEVCHTDQLYDDGDKRDLLPDLIVRWKETPAIVNSVIESPRFGSIERKTPHRIPNGRSGNHRPEGFLIVRGNGIPAETQLQENPDIIDLAPTILHCLGAHTSLPLSGRLISELAC
jgi:predicted AlkP superfamily phosphohydrolase/phosphomutase